MSRPGEHVELEAFLAGLDEAEAAGARAAAAEIDRLARIGAPLEGIERRLLPWAVAGAVLFAVGLGVLITPGASAGWWIVALLGALPLVVAVYAVRVAPRTDADNRADALNRAHFLPRGGLYLPPGEHPAAVLRVAPEDAARASSPAPREARG